MQLESHRGVPSRRAIVRAGAWTVPAISLAVAAPARATASDEPRLDFALAGSGVTPGPEGTWDFFFRDAVIWVNRDVPPGELAITVSFVPEPGYSVDVLAVHEGGPAGFSSQDPGTATEITYVYAPGVNAGDQVQIQDGIWFGTAWDPQHQVGRFQLTASAPGLAPVTYTSIVVPATQRLSFDPGTSYATSVPDPDGGGFDVWTMVFQGASVRVSDGVVSDPANLRLTITFVPDPGYTQDFFRDTGTSPAGWLADDPSPHQESTWLYADVVDASVNDVVLPLTDGWYFTTVQSGDDQRGSFQLTVYDIYDGFGSAIYRMHVPSGPSLTFDPGSSFVQHDTTGGSSPRSWELDFQGASVTVSGADLAAGDLSMDVSFEPDPGAGPYRDFWVQDGGPVGWTQQYLSDQDFPSYHYLDTVMAAGSDVAVPISDGVYFTTAVADVSDGQRGDIVLKFRAPGCQSDTYRVHVPAT